MDESRSYPRCKHHYSGEVITVKSAEEEIALGGGIASTPAEWFPYQGPGGSKHDTIRSSGLTSGWLMVSKKPTE